MSSVGSHPQIHFDQAQQLSNGNSSGDETEMGIEENKSQNFGPPKENHHVKNQERICAADKLTFIPSHPEFNKIGLYQNSAKQWRIIEKLLTTNEQGKLELKENAFYPIKNGRQFIWVADARSYAHQIKQIVKMATRSKLSVHINTGTHGDQQGNHAYKYPDYAEGKFIQEDFETIKNLDHSNNVSVHVVSSLSREIYPPKANWIINSWCFSEETPIKTQKFSDKKSVKILSNCSCGENKVASLDESGVINVVKYLPNQPYCGSCKELRRFKIKISNLGFAVDGQYRKIDGSLQGISDAKKQPCNKIIELKQPLKYLDLRIF